MIIVHQQLSRHGSEEKWFFEPRVMRPINTFYRPITVRVCFDNKLAGFAREASVRSVVNSFDELDGFIDILSRRSDFPTEFFFSGFVV